MAYALFGFVLLVAGLLIYQQISGRVWLGSRQKYSIGLYAGDTPLVLAPLAGVRNPILTKFDVTDVRADFLADPFIAFDGLNYHVFMEVLSKRGSKKIGEICVASGASLTSLRYDRVVLREPYHLSYPYVFQYDNQWFMIPESGANHSVDLYRAFDFPHDWRKVKTLLSGCAFADANVFEHEGLWWLLVGVNEDHSTRLYFSDSFDGDFVEHPQSPIYVQSRSFYRNAGKLIRHDGVLYRVSQNAARFYGEKVEYHRVTALNPQVYAEEYVGVLVEPTGMGWNARQMHHVDVVEVNHQFWAVVDGATYAKENVYWVNRFLRWLLPNQ